MNIYLKLFLFTLLLSNSSTLFSQIPINFGFIGGVSHSKYEISLDTIDGENVTAWQAGVFARIKIKKIYVGLDALFLSNPGKFSSTSGSTKGEISVIGVNIPLYLGWKIVDKKAFNLRIFSGPAIQLNFYERIKSSYNGGTFETSENLKFQDGPKWSLVGGLGFDIAFFTLDARYLYSVSDWSNISNTEVNNNGVQFNIGFKIL